MSEILLLFKLLATLLLIVRMRTVFLYLFTTFNWLIFTGGGGGMEYFLIEICIHKYDFILF